MNSNPPRGVSRCWACGFDLRRFMDSDWKVRRRRWKYVSLKLLSFQEFLLQSLDRGWGELNGTGPIYSHLIFQGVRQILRILTRPHAVKGFKAGVLGVESVAPTWLRGLRYGGGRAFETLGGTARAARLEAVAWVLSEWPSRFVKTCKTGGIGEKFFLETLGRETPYWLWCVVRAELHVLYAPWRNPMISRVAQISYGALAQRNLSPRLAAQDLRIDFLRAHPELWGDPHLLALQLKEACLYKPGTGLWAIAKHTKKLLLLAQDPNEWWRRH